MKTILITGGAGFIGSHIVEHVLENTDWNIVIVDRLNYASSGFDRLHDIDIFDENRIKIFTADFTKPIVEGLAKEIGQVDYILHMGAETHVDSSIENPEPFIMSNIVGTMHMLNFARTQEHLKAFLYFSTDEVFGPAPEGVLYKEWSRYNAGNPYAATKAGGEELCLAYANTYGVPVIITHTMNVFGERQHVEKFIPKVIRAVLNGEKVYIHANKEKTKAGSRFWIHARNVGTAIMFLFGLNQKYGTEYWRKEWGGWGIEEDKRLPTGSIVNKFNIVGECEVDNLEMARFIANALGKPLDYELVDFHSSRPGHDLRYALDGSKMKAMGWSLPVTFEDSLRKTIRWTVANPKWLELKK